jgi:hypothetical protein
MIQLRERLLNDKNTRKPVNTRRLDEADFLEIDTKKAGGEEVKII